MSKKLIGLSLALAAWFALTLAPTVATASPALTYPTGTRLATGSLLQITNIGVNVFTESEWRLECPTARVTGKLVTNSGSALEIELSTFEMHGVGVGEDCRQDRTNPKIETEVGASVRVTYSGLPWCLRATSLMSADSFDIKAAHCGEAAKAITLVLNYTGIKECKYETSSIQGTFTTDGDGDAILTMTPEFKGEASNSFLCAASMATDTQMTVEKDSLLAEPVYIS